MRSITTMLVHLWLLAATPASALVGFETHMYNPPCAYACRDLIAMAPLSCSKPMTHGGEHMHGADGMTTPECRAQDTPFLTTLAYCMETKCAPYQVKPSLLQKYWEDQTTGDKAVTAKWTYASTLQQITEPPSLELGEEQTLNFTAKLSDEKFKAGYDTNVAFEREEKTHATYCIAVLVTGFGTPILLSAIRYLPFTSALLHKVRPVLLYRSTFKTYHVRALPYYMGNAPLLGQALYVGLMVLLNVFLTCFNYQTVDNFTWYESTQQEVLGFIMWRTGTIAFSLAPLVLLFSSRNNVLLWLTNWSHSTYLLLHRWIAWIFGIQTLLHSIVALRLYIETKSFKEEQKLDYWIWGSVATVAVCIMLVGSKLYVRRLSYEIFLVGHIILAVIVLVGCWYHVEFRFHRKYGYEQWLYAAFVVWFFDRAVRVLRVVKHGINRATVTELGSEYVRVDVKGIRWAADPGMHVYMYFPTVSRFRPWENHPFSVMPTALLRSSKKQEGSSVSSDSVQDISEASDPEKAGVVTIQHRHTFDEQRTSAGLTLFIRKSSGTTRRLQNQQNLVTLLDGPYPNNPTSDILTCDRILLLGGGIGITALVPWLQRHSNVKLAWSVRENAQCLVEELQPLLDTLPEKEILVGQRLDMSALVKNEIHAGWMRIGIVCSGPAEMLDHAREIAEIAQANHPKVRLELHTDAYLW